EERERIAALYQQLAGTGRTANDLVQVVATAHQGQLQYLFVPTRTECWGTFDATTGKAELHHQRQPGDEDLLNLAAVFALSHKATVYAVEPGEVPGGGAVAAIYWLPLGQRSSKRTI